MSFWKSLVRGVENTARGVAGKGPIGAHSPKMPAGSMPSDGEYHGPGGDAYGNAGEGVVKYKTKGIPGLQLPPGLMKQYMDNGTGPKPAEEAPGGAGTPPPVPHPSPTPAPRPGGNFLASLGGLGAGQNSKFQNLFSQLNLNRGGSSLGSGLLASSPLFQKLAGPKGQPEPYQPPAPQ